MTHLHALIPRNKLDTEQAEALVALGYPAVAPVLPDLLECVADRNWPIAQVLLPLLVGIGAPLAPHIRHILQNEDYWWQYNILLGIVYYSPELARELAPELRQLAQGATPAQQAEELDIIAREILERYPDQKQL